MKKKPALKQKVAKSPTKVLTFMDRLPKDQGERLELMIRMTAKHANPSSKDDFMGRQQVRFEAELAKWRADNEK